MVGKGGGYNLPGGVEYFVYLHHLVETLQSHSNLDVSVLVLDYDLATDRTYPRQLSQAASLLSYVTSVLLYPVNRILLGGDSAGANLALALLGHILHPHPQEDTVPKISLPEGTKLCGMLLISPWVTFRTDSKSMTRNALKDNIAPRALSRWASVFMGRVVEDPYNQPLSAPC